MNLPNPDGLQVVLTVCTLVALWLGWAKVIFPRIRRRWNRVVGLFQTIAGRDAVIDKRDGTILSPAVPHLGEQLSTLNDTVSKLVAVIESNHDAHRRIDHHDRVLGGHDQAIAALIAGSAERAATALASAALLSAVANRDDLNEDI